MMTDDSWRRLYDSYMHDMNIEYGFDGKAPNKFSPTKIPMVIPTFTPHELRHTFCTIMFEAGIDPLTAKEQLGHSDIKTTLSIYTHLSNEYKENDVKKLDEFLKGGSKVAQQFS
jgi:integrase